MRRLVFVGPGRVGLALGAAIAEATDEVKLVYQGRRERPPHHPLFHRRRASYRHGLEAPPEGTTAIILSVPDAVLPEVAMALAARGEAPQGCAAFHTSGALGADPLGPLHERGYAVGTLHPLRAVATSEPGADGFRRTSFAVSGSPDALAVADGIVSLVGGSPLKVPANRRPLYHAAAVLASNYLVVLLHEAVGLLEQAGASREEAERALASLARGTMENVVELGLDRALTGPLLRGDVETVELHLRTLSEKDGALYAELGRRGLEWVGTELPGEARERLEQLFGGLS